MTQPTLTAVRDALAAYLSANISGLRSVASRLGDINVPCAVVMPETGLFADYQVSMDGQVDYHLRVIVLASAGDSETGQDVLDGYLATSGSGSVWAAVRADPTLGGVVAYAQVVQATGYGLMNFSGVDYLAASIIVIAGC